MKPFKRTEVPVVELDPDKLPWIPEELRKNISKVTSFLKSAFEGEVSRIGIYGSWQRGTAESNSDIDMVVFLNHEVPWFGAKNGIVSRSAARKDRYRWYTIERRVNRTVSRIYSISVVTPAMLEYYSLYGPIHLQNWVTALLNCHIIWKD